MTHFLDADRKTDYLLPPSMEDWLPEGHLARFIVEVIEQLDLSQLVKQYAGRGCKAYHSSTLLAILDYGYASGVFSSRKLEQATYDSVAPSVISRQAPIRITIPWPPSAAVSWMSCKTCSCRCWNWPRK